MGLAVTRIPAALRDEKHCISMPHCLDVSLMLTTLFKQSIATMEQLITNAKKDQLKKILIIDDEGDTCFLLSNVLKDEHFEIDHVNTLSQAEIFMREERPYLIFLD